MATPPSLYIYSRASNEETHTSMPNEVLPRQIPETGDPVVTSGGGKCIVFLPVTPWEMGGRAHINVSNLNRRCVWGGGGGGGDVPFSLRHK